MPSLGLAASVNASAVSGITSAVAPLSFIGYQTNTEGENYAVSNWSLTTSEKKFNVGATEKYGTSGYYLIRPIPKDQANLGASLSGSTVASLYNDLGVTAQSWPTQYVAPSFATVSGGGGSFVNYFGYTSFLSADTTQEFRTGALSLSAVNGPYATPSGNMYFADALFITLNQAADFVLGIATNTVGYSYYSPRYITLYSQETGTVFSPLSPIQNNIPTMTFFRIKGQANQVFSVALWSQINNGVVTFSLVTFDRL